jgi:AraC-like DNA-binding protein
MMTAPARSRTRHQDPHTTVGVHLTRFALQGQGPFLIHECGYLPDGIPWNFPGVRSPYWRLYYNHDAGSVVRSGGRVFPLTPDRVVVIPEDVLFDCVGEKGTSHLWMHFAPVGTAAPPLRDVHVVPLRPTIRTLLAALVAVHRAAPTEQTPQRLYHAAAAVLHASFAQLDAPLLRPHPERLEDILSFVQTALASPLSVPVLARRAGMSVAHFSRWFKEQTGSTPADHILRSRIRRVRQLLVLSDESIDQIAEDTGFTNRFHMSRVFKKLAGCGPATFRRRHVRA